MDRSRALKLFIGNTSSKVAADDDGHLDSEQVNLVHFTHSIVMFQNGMFTEAFYLVKVELLSIICRRTVFTSVI